MLTAYEIFLTAFSTAAAGLSFIALLALLVRAILRRWRRANRGYVARELAGMDMRVDGFTFECDHSRNEMTVTSHPDPQIKRFFEADLRDYSTDQEICPALDSMLHVRADEEILTNLRSDCSRLTPFIDFVVSWWREIDGISLRRNRAELSFRCDGKGPLMTPVDLLPAIMRDAATGLRALYEAAATRSDRAEKRDAANPPWIMRIPVVLEIRFAFLVAGLVLSMVTAALVALHYHSILRDREAMSWPSVEGEMITSQVEHTRSPNARPSENRIERDYYKAVIEYRYEVRGETFVRYRYSFLEEVVHEEDYALDVVSDHPVGAKVRVFYDPEDPGESVIHLHGDGPNLLHQALHSLAYMPAMLVLAFFAWVAGVVRSARRRLMLERSRRV